MTLIYQLAGVIGIIPDMLTLRELVVMSRASQESRWNHTATMLAMQANINRDPKKRSKPFEPMEFHPLNKKNDPFRQSITEMKEHFTEAFKLKQVK